MFLRGWRLSLWAGLDGGSHMLWCIYRGVYISIISFWGPQWWKHNTYITMIFRSSILYCLLLCLDVPMLVIGLSDRMQPFPLLFHSPCPDITHSLDPMRWVNTSWAVLIFKLVEGKVPISSNLKILQFLDIAGRKIYSHPTGLDTLSRKMILASPVERCRHAWSEVSISRPDMRFADTYIFHTNCRSRCAALLPQHATEEWIRHIGLSHRKNHSHASHLSTPVESKVSNPAK